MTTLAPKPPFLATDVSLLALGKAIARRRGTLSKSQAEMSGIIGIHFVTMSRVESGLVDIKFTTLLRICEGLAITPGKLIQLAKLMEERGHAEDTV